MGPTDGPLRLGGAVQQLHLVGFTTDHKGLILAARRGAQEGGYVVTLDQQLVEQIEELLRLQADERESAGPIATRNGTAPVLRRPKVESRLTPREVQSMLRTGHSVGEIAETAGMSEDWVARFAPPVLAEQARVVARALEFTYTKPRLGPSILPLGESVVWNLAERNVMLTGDAFEEAWSAFQLPDGGWVVRVSYLAERRHQHADWIVDMAQGGLRAVNRLGNELGFVEAGRRRPQVLPPPAPVSPAAQRAAATPPKPVPPAPLPARASGRLSMLGGSPGSRPPGLVRPAIPEQYRDPRPSDRAPARASSPPPAPQASVLPPRPVDPSLVSVHEEHEAFEETAPEFAPAPQPALRPLRPSPPPPGGAGEEARASHVRVIPAVAEAEAEPAPITPGIEADPLTLDPANAEEVQAEANLSRSASPARGAERAGLPQRRPRPLRPPKDDAGVPPVRTTRSGEGSRTGTGRVRERLRDATPESRATGISIRRQRPLRASAQDELGEPEPVVPRVSRPLAPRTSASPRPPRSLELRPRAAGTIPPAGTPRRAAASGLGDRRATPGRPRRLVAARPIERTDDVRLLGSPSPRTDDRAGRLRSGDESDARLSRSSDAPARSDAGGYRLRPRPRARLADGAATRAERLEAVDAEAADDNGGASTARNRAVRRRPLRSTDPLGAAPAEASTPLEPDASSEPEPPRVGRGSRERGGGGPITAPTPIVRVFEDYDTPLDSPSDLEEPVRSRDTVLIRAGQAGTPEPIPPPPSAAGSQAPSTADRPGRAGRLRFRRRFSG